MPYLFESERLRFREFNFDDAENLYQLNLDPEVIKYTGDPPFESKETARLFIYNYKEYKLNGFGRWAVELKADGRFIGWSGLKINELDKVDLGYRFFKSEWGKGYATEAAKACLEYGFNKLAMMEIIARCAKENLASVKVIEKLGMEFYMEGVCKTMDDANYYNIKREQFLNSQS